MIGTSTFRMLISCLIHTAKYLQRGGRRGVLQFFNVLLFPWEILKFPRWEEISGNAVCVNGFQ